MDTAVSWIEYLQSIGPHPLCKLMKEQEWQES